MGKTTVMSRTVHLVRTETSQASACLTLQQLQGQTGWLQPQEPCALGHGAQQGLSTSSAACAGMLLPAKPSWLVWILQERESLGLLWQTWCPCLLRFDTAAYSAKMLSVFTWTISTSMADGLYRQCHFWLLNYQQKSACRSFSVTSRPFNLLTHCC